ncbi:MAG: histidinol-phosphate transaminase [Candidatus Margulisiibacteriota bacterium]
MVTLNAHIANLQPYVPGKPIEEVERDYGLTHIIKLASNENTWGIPTSVRRKLYPKLKDIFRYPDGSLYRLRTKLSHQLNIRPDQLIFGNGSDELLQIIALAYLGSDKEVLVSAGTFSEYQFCATLVNAPTHVIPLLKHTYALTTFAEAVGPKTSVIFLCNPNNPTGTAFGTRSFEAFMKKVPSHVLVILDEAYFEYAQGEGHLDGLRYVSQYPNLMILRTFSKLWALAGLRLGYGVAHSSLVAGLSKARQPFNVNRFAEEAALLMLDEPGWAQKVRNELDREKRKIYRSLDRLGVSYLVSRANFIFIELGQSASEICEALLHMGIIVRALNGFGFPEAIRVTVGRPSENKAFLSAFEKVLKKSC